MKYYICKNNCVPDDVKYRSLSVNVDIDMDCWYISHLSDYILLFNMSHSDEIIIALLAIESFNDTDNFSASLGRSVKHRICRCN